MENNVKVYLPDNSIRKGYGPIFGEIFRELVTNRWLTYQLFKRDFFALYKQSFIGMLWVLIIPIFSVSTFIVLKRSGIFNIGALDAPYPIFAILGISFWQLFSSGLIASTNSLVEAGSMIKIISFSKKSLVISAIGRSVISFLIQFLLVGLLFAAYRRAPHAWILLAPFMAMPLILLTLGFGFILSLLNAVMRDIGNALSMLMTFLMFLTPVLYTKPQTGLLAQITHYNPMYYLISSPRDLILTGHLSEPKGYAFSVLFSIVLFVVCLIVFHLTETKITERV